MSEEATPVTIFELARYRLNKLQGRQVAEGESLNGKDFQDVGLQILGGCVVCEASLAAYNGCPSKSGYWKCASGCIGDDGWLDVEQANKEIFEDAEGSE